MFAVRLPGTAGSQCQDQAGFRRQGFRGHEPIMVVYAISMGHLVFQRGGCGQSLTQDGPQKLHDPIRGANPRLNGHTRVQTRSAPR